MGKLKIKLIECRNLVNKDISSLSDPYVVFAVHSANDKKAKQTQKSTIKKDNLHPVFNEKFVFEK